MKSKIILALGLFLCLAATHEAKAQYAGYGQYCSSNGWNGPICAPGLVCGNPYGGTGVCLSRGTFACSYHAQCGFGGFCWSGWCHHGGNWHHGGGGGGWGHPGGGWGGHHGGGGWGGHHGPGHR